MKIPIPHLGYWVLVKISPKEFYGSQEKSIMFCEDTDRSNVTIFFRKKPTQSEAGTVAHEVMHALQYIARNRNIKMEKELEHFGYLMQYIFNEIYNFKYLVPKD